MELNDFIKCSVCAKMMLTAVVGENGQSGHKRCIPGKSYNNIYYNNYVGHLVGNTKLLDKYIKEDLTWEEIFGSFYFFEKRIQTMKHNKLFTYTLIAIKMNYCQAAKQLLMVMNNKNMDVGGPFWGYVTSFGMLRTLLEFPQTNMNGKDDDGLGCFLKSCMNKKK